MPTKQQSLLTQDSQSDELLYREWYFGFCENAAPLSFLKRWITRNDPPHLKHCYAFTQVGDYLLFVEPEHDRIEFVIKYPTEDHPKLDAVQTAIDLTEAGHVVVSNVYIPNIRGIKSIFNFIPSCVTVVKCATGYSSYAITPKNLLHSLIKDGAYVFLQTEK